MKKSVMLQMHFTDETVMITDPCYLSEFADDDKWISFVDHFYSNASRIEKLVPYDEKKRTDFFARMTLECNNVTSVNDLSDEQKTRLKTALEADKQQYEEYGNDRRTQCLYLNYDQKMIVSGTIFGDWSCSVIDNETSKEIGQFCSDAGMVCVFKKGDFHIKEEIVDWSVCEVPNFTGEVSLMFYELEYGDKGYTEPDENGFSFFNSFVQVEGKGSINFHSTDDIFEQ